MADFADAIGPLFLAEGGLSNHPDDKGGQTYKGIARKFHPSWAGWYYVDRGEDVPDRLVIDFYRAEFWLPIKADSIMSQRIANALFSYAVNAGVSPAVKLAQQAVCVDDDGVPGRITLFALNSVDPEIFLAKFALARIRHRIEVCKKDPSQRQFLVGWISRDLKECA